MTEAEVIRIMRGHLERQFPKTCPNCQRRFDSLRDFILETTRNGSAIPYDAELGDWAPSNPVGTATFVNCQCGSTLALTSEGMPLLKLWSLLAWARKETRRRGITARELLNHLRDQVCLDVVGPPGAEL